MSNNPEKKPIAIVDYPKKNSSGAYGPLPSDLCKYLVIKDLESEGYAVEIFDDLNKITEPGKYSGIFIHPGAEKQREATRYILENQDIKMSLLLLHQDYFEIEVSKFPERRRVWILPYSDHYIVNFIENNPAVFARKFKKRMNFRKEENLKI